MIEEDFNEFIKKWCGSSYPHLIDNDENDGELFRQKLRDMIDKQKVKEVAKKWKSGLDYISLDLLKELAKWKRVYCWI